MQIEVMPNDNIHSAIAAVECAIEMNTQMDNSLKELHHRYQLKLVECRNKLCELISRSKSKKKKNVISIDTYWRFHDNMFSPNAAVNVHKDYRMPYRWTGIDKHTFRSALESQGMAWIHKELHGIQKQLSLKNESTGENHLDLLKYKNDLETMKTHVPFKPPVHINYDWYAVAKKLKKRHSAQECQSMWEQFENPEVNKSTWTRTEALKLVEIAVRHNESGWEAIAKELNTKRSMIQCFIYYVTNIKNKQKVKWTDDEDEILRRLVEELKLGNYVPWQYIASKMGKRKSQVYIRWKQSLQPDVKKGRFLPEEDTVLLTCVKRYGLDFKKIAKFVTGRNTIQLQNRYRILQNACSTEWTIEEDRLLVQLMAGHGNRNSFSKVSQHFPGKNRSHLRMRYMTLCKWMTRFPNVDLALAPRHRTRLLNHGKTAGGIEDALTGLNKKLTKIVETPHVEKPKKDKRKLLLRAIFAEMIKRRSEVLGFKHNNYLEQLDVDSEATLHLWGLKTTMPNIRTYSKKDALIAAPSRNVFHSFDIYTNAIYYFPPNYASCIGCRTLLQQFVGCRRRNTIGSSCAKDISFDNEWTSLLYRFKSIFVLPLMLIEIGIESD